MGQNYLRSLFALGFQAFLIIFCIAVYAVLVQTITLVTDISAAIWTCIWDANYQCTKCHYQGRDISKAILNIDGDLFDYTGSEIRAAHIVGDNGQWLSVRSDKNGLDGYSHYLNNTEIGTATLIIDGVGNCYGKLTGTFQIVPVIVETITATEQTEGEETSSLTFNWQLGAEYYELYRLNDQTNKWVSVATVDDPITTYTVHGLEIGESCQFKLASRAHGKDGNIYYCAKWSNIISGTIEHHWVEDEAQRHEATCTEPGVTVRKCSVCQKQEKVTIPALGHTVTDWKTVKEPTYTEEGQRTGQCSRCSKEVTKAIPKLQYVSPGTVAVAVHPDGTEEIVRDCVIGENGTVLNVEGDVTLKIVDNTETFVDVEPVDHWTSDAVEFVAARQLFNGTGDNTFTPDGDMTRGMLVTVLYRLAYEPAAGSDGFADVPESAYYTDAVAWAGRNGIVQGKDATHLAPSANATRAEVATIMMRFCEEIVK